MRVVLDTNVVISAVFWAGTPFRILEGWIAERFELVVSEPILEEYARVLFEISKHKRDNRKVATADHRERDYRAADEKISSFKRSR